jgi:predicted nucleotidyltransferase
MSIQEIKNKIRPILKRHDVKKAAIFGSYARGDQNKKSDVDILVEYKNDDKSLFDIMDLQADLEKALSKKVDLGEFSAIRPRIKEKILSEQVPVYEERA